MEQIFLACDLSNKNFAAIMMLYKNTKAIVHSSDGDMGFFNIVAEIMQSDSVAL